MLWKISFQYDLWEEVSSTHINSRFHCKYKRVELCFELLHAVSTNLYLKGCSCVETP